MGLIAEWFMGLFSLRYFYFVLHDIIILLLKPENTLSARRPQSLFKLISLPAGNDLSQPEWTFSGDEIEQFLFLMKG